MDCATAVVFDQVGHVASIVPTAVDHAYAVNVARGVKVDDAILDAVITNSALPLNSTCADFGWLQIALSGSLEPRGNPVAGAGDFGVSKLDGRTVD